MKKTVAELWEDIFEKYNIISVIDKKGLFRISADQIRDYKEPRLMTKFDFSKQLPDVFKRNNLGILPINNGEYIIGRFYLFQNIANTSYENIEPIKVQLPDYIKTIDPDNIYSESNALNVALLSGMITKSVGEDVVETIQGKMRATGFSFEIDGTDGKKQIEIDRPAMEIDGGYESKNKVVLIEAKNYLPKDFIIRQLYFPYRHWKEKVSKPIIPIFFAYDNGIYTFFIYEFADLYDYNSLSLKEIKRYIINDKSSDDLKRNIFKNVETVEDLPQRLIPFPQADSFNRIIGIADLVDSKINTAIDISEEYEFDVRQGSYYLAAAKYLDIIDKVDGEYVLTPLGYAVVNLDMRSRNEKLIEAILKHKVFNEAYKYYLNNEKIPDRVFIIELMKKYTDIQSEETLNRRASTVRGWVEWIIGAQV